MKIGEALRGKRVFVTGHTGFKGSWLTLLLKRLGCHTIGYSLPPPTFPSLFEAGKIRELVDEHHEADVRDADRLARVVRTSRPDVVMHLAAQPLVRRSYREPLETWGTNVLGTASVLDAVRLAERPCAVVIVTSDKCYEPSVAGAPHSESDPMGGHDPYSASKGAAELVTAAFRRSYFPPEKIAVHGVHVASVRAGNVVGGGDWAEDRIVTDIVRELGAGRPVPVRNPAAIRPWQHVLDPLCGYLMLAERMLGSPGANWCSSWNFGPSDAPDLTVAELVQRFIAEWDEGRWEVVPQAALMPETAVLRLRVDKARRELGWAPRFSPEESIGLTARWFRGFYQRSQDPRALCEADIQLHESQEGRRP